MKKEWKIFKYLTLRADSRHVITCKNISVARENDKFTDNFGFVLAHRVYVCRWNYYEPNRNENDRGTLIRSRAKFARDEKERDSSDERERSSTSSFYCRQIECRLSRADSRGKSKEAEIGEGRSRARFTRMYPACHVVVVEASLTTTRNSPVTVRIRYSVLSRHNSVPLSSLYDAVSTKGYLEVCRIFAWRYASAHVCSRTRAPAVRPSNPLIGFIRASSITLSQGYIPSPIVEPNDAYLPR